MLEGANSETCTRVGVISPETAAGQHVDARTQRLSLQEFAWGSIVIPVSAAREADVPEQAAALVLVARQLTPGRVDAAEIYGLGRGHRVPTAKAVMGRAHARRRAFT
eukprot:scaffold14029_cov121-Isochrysis_galbana.AAC.14